jgi:uncharacterized surface protein with fasciclin (FAS1) repeats
MLKSIISRQKFPGILILMLAIVTFSCSDDDPDPIQPMGDNIVELLQDDARFTTLVDAVIRADLADALSADGALTVFAPTNQAFADAGITDVNAVPVNDLAEILLYHVVDAEVPSSNVAAGSVTSFGGSPFFISIAPDNSIWINGSAEIIETDLDATNGVVHVIDNVLMEPTQSIAEIAVGFTMETNPEFTQLVGALSRASLVSAVSGGFDDNLTVFAPTDAAFEDLYNDLGVDGYEDIPLATLTDVLLYHVVPARAFSQDLRDGAELPTLLTNETSTVDLPNLQIDDAGLVPELLNVHATNGAIHVIDSVMLP